MLRPYTCLDAAQLYDVAADFDPELFQQQLAHSAAGHARYGLARAGPLQDVARVLAVVLQAAGQVGVPWRRRSVPGASASGAITSRQCSQSRFHTSMAIGEPSVSPARTPASHSIWSASIFMRAPRP